MIVCDECNEPLTPQNFYLDDIGTDFDVIYCIKCCKIKDVEYEN